MTRLLLNETPLNMDPLNMEVSDTYMFGSGAVTTYIPRPGIEPHSLVSVANALPPRHRQ